MASHSPLLWDYIIFQPVSIISFIPVFSSSQCKHRSVKDLDITLVYQTAIQSCVRMAPPESISPYSYVNRSFSLTSLQTKSLFMQDRRRPSWISVSWGYTSHWQQVLSLGSRESPQDGGQEAVSAEGVGFRQQGVNIISLSRFKREWHQRCRVWVADTVTTAGAKLLQWVTSICVFPS